MKPSKGIPSLFLTFLCLYSLADTVRLPCMLTPLSRDKLRSNFWNLGECNLVAEDVKAWVTVSQTGFVTEYDSPDARHYLIRGDSLLFRGYTTGNDIAAVTDSMCLSLRLPLAGGYSSSSRYCLEGYLSGRRAFREVGICETKVIGEGDLVFAPGDTLRTVLVHEVHRHMPDGAAYGKGGECRDEYWRWYTPGSRLPVAVQTSPSGSTEDRLLTVQYDDYILENKNEAHHVTPDTGRIVSDARISVSGGHVAVTLAGCEGLAAEVSLVDPQGNLYGHASGGGNAEGLTLRIGTRGMPRGFYMMVITVHDPGSGSETSTEKRMISI